MAKRNDDSFIAEREGEQIAKLRHALERDGVINTSANTLNLPSAPDGPSPVDIRPEIAAAFAWTKFVAGQQKKKSTSEKGQQASMFEVEKGPGGTVRIVPKKQPPRMSRAEMDNFLVTEIYKHPGKTVEQLKQEHPHLFQDNAISSFPAWLSAEEEARRKREQRQAEKPWFYASNWLKSTMTLLTLSKGRFKLLRDGQYKDMKLPGHPALEAAALPPLSLGEVRAQMEEGRHLLEQRKALLAKVAEVETRMVAIGMEPGPRVGGGGGGSRYPGIGMTYMERRAEGGRLAFQALGIASVLVAAGAIAGGLAFSRYTGVEDVEGLAAFVKGEFHRFRHLKDASYTLSGHFRRSLDDVETSSPAVLTRSVADRLRALPRQDGGDENTEAGAV